MCEEKVLQAKEDSKLIDLVVDEGYPKFQIMVDNNIDYSMSFSVYEVISWDSAVSKRAIKTKHYIHGYIGWDGLSHVWFGVQDGNNNSSGYLFFNGKAEWIAHSKVMVAIYELAEKSIVNYFAGTLKE